mmetsp:Transcript_30676/g.74740  ORF Transcript_30676/g.74740 Transcript_30676/m.74740 type:complete len:387 (+) Transcript_30676:346-1506(+)
MCIYYAHVLYIAQYSVANDGRQPSKWYNHAVNALATITVVMYMISVVMVLITGKVRYQTIRSIATVFAISCALVFAIWALHSIHFAMSNSPFYASANKRVALKELQKTQRRLSNNIEVKRTTSRHISGGKAFNENPMKHDPNPSGRVKTLTLKREASVGSVNSAEMNRGGSEKLAGSARNPVSSLAPSPSLHGVRKESEVKRSYPQINPGLANAREGSSNPISPNELGNSPKSPIYGTKVEHGSPQRFSLPPVALSPTESHEIGRDSRSKKTGMSESTLPRYNSSLVHRLTIRVKEEDKRRGTFKKITCATYAAYLVGLLAIMAGVYTTFIWSQNNRAFKDQYDPENYDIPQEIFNFCLMLGYVFYLHYVWVRSPCTCENPDNGNI